MVNNASGNAGSMTFHTYDLGATMPERMRITNTGNVGINIAAPDGSMKLHVDGNIAAGLNSWYYFGGVTNGIGCNSGGDQIKFKTGNAVLMTLTAGNLAVNGSCTAASFSGDGSALTGIPSGVTKQTTTPSATDGDQWYDTDNDVFYVKVDGVWKALASAFSATGGTITTSGGYKFHTFTSSGTFTADGSGSVDYLIVAGGGSAGCNNGGGHGGGGAGGYLSGTISLTSQSYSIIVGAGGASNSGVNHGNQGNPSSALGISTVGGGYGNCSLTSGGGNGGSGGGGGEFSDSRGDPGIGTAGQGNNGGTGTGSGTNSGAGGGGAGTQGGHGDSANGSAGPREGGAGLSWLNGSWYAGGGGASGNNRQGGNGGIGGGGGGGAGSGGSYSSQGYSSGAVNTGGGGGAAYQTGSPAKGGSGIVIIRYAF
jgi:hypothetical protein